MRQAGNAPRDRRALDASLLDPLPARPPVGPPTSSSRPDYQRSTNVSIHSVSAPDVGRAHGLRPRGAPESPAIRDRPRGQALPVDDAEQRSDRQLNAGG